MANHHGMHEPQPAFNLEGSNWQENFHKGIEAYLRRWVTRQELLLEVDEDDYAQTDGGRGRITGADDYGYEAELTVIVADLETGSIHAGASNKEVREDISLPFPEEPNVEIDSTLPTGAFIREQRIFTPSNGEPRVFTYYYMNPPNTSSRDSEQAPH